MRIGGTIIWTTDFREETRTSTQGGGKGGGPRVKTTQSLYTASFALCEGPITGIGRIWADGTLMDRAGVTWCRSTGDETQSTDPFIAATMARRRRPPTAGRRASSSRRCPSSASATAWGSCLWKYSGRSPIRTPPRG